MSKIMDVIKGRRSIRKFKPDMISREAINEIIEAGLYAASGMGKQSPIVIAITNKDARDKIMAQNRAIGGWNEDFDPFYGAPVILIVLANKDAATYVYDGSLMLGNMMTAAQNLGIGSIWIHRAKEEFESDEGKALLRELGIEGDYEGIGHLAIGYADCDNPEAHPRKDNRVFFVE